MFGPNSILDMARGALFASQAALQVTGENIANVNTDGYARRSVRFVEGFSIDYQPGQMGTGVVAKEVVRHFDEFVEEAYYDKNTTRQRWETLYQLLQTSESLFNESDGYGISDSLSQFFNSWEDLTQRPEDYGSRRNLVNATEGLVSTLQQTDSDLALLQQRTEELIKQDVNEANDIMVEIAEINRKIAVHDNPGYNNANSLYDERARLLRDLDSIIDIQVIDNGGGDLTVLTRAGQNLVDGVNHFELSYEAARVEHDLQSTSNFDGEVYYEGSDNYEYTLEVVNGGYVSNGTAATFRVSLDGGQTWLKNEDGTQRTFSARPEDGKVQVEDLTIWFGSATNPQGNPTQPLVAGDTITIVPKQGLYWVENTSKKENITPQTFFNGEDNPRRVTGGTLAAYFNYRDEYLGEYRDKLSSLSESLVWEVNLRHSQGVGKEKMAFTQGTYSVERDDLALGSDSAGLVYGDRLTSGSSMVYVYSTDTGLLVSGAALDWSDAPGQQNFDPEVHTLNSAAAAFNRTFGGAITATVVNHELRLECAEGYQMAFGTDTTGLTAALGINTFFSGSNAQDLALNEKIGSDLDYICTGHVNGAGEGNEGDNSTALSISELQTDDVTIHTTRDGTSSQALLDFYNGLVGTVGSDTYNAEFNFVYNKALADDLDARQQEVSGVNLDEEMSNLIKYQHSYTAAAKLISTADQMIQTLLTLKS